jgi:hypothetical protein
VDEVVMDVEMALEVYEEVDVEFALSWFRNRLSNQWWKSLETVCRGDFRTLVTSGTPTGGS